ncbi:MAG: hypothetical protein ABIP35_13970 [Ginsengibacter sp.]
MITISMPEPAPTSIMAPARASIIFKNKIENTINSKLQVKNNMVKVVFKNSEREYFLK